jgi:hypothetical protein
VVALLDGVPVDAFADGLADRLAEALGDGLAEALGSWESGGTPSGDSSTDTPAAGASGFCPLWMIANPDANSAHAANPAAIRTHLWRRQPPRCATTA